MFQVSWTFFIYHVKNHCDFDLSYFTGQTVSKIIVNMEKNFNKVENLVWNLIIRGLFRSLAGNWS